MINCPKPVGISVLICTYNGAARITETLRHLARQITLQILNWEIILVDNASTDNILEIATSFWNTCKLSIPLRVYSQPQPGKNHALELAYQNAIFSFMCIVDDDNWLAPDYLQNGYDILLSRNNIGILGGRTTGAYEVEPPEWFLRYQNYYAIGAPIIEVDGVPHLLPDGEVLTCELWGAGMFVRHSVWEDMNAAGFESLLTGRKGEQNLVAGEDHELCYAARMLGYSLWYSSSLHLVHFMTKGRLTESYLDRLLQACAKGYLQLLPYRTALLNGRQEKEITLNIVKDAYYILKTTASNIFSRDYLLALVGKNKMRLFFCNENVRYLLELPFVFDKIKSDNKKVLMFKVKAKMINSMVEEVK